MLTIFPLYTNFLELLFSAKTEWLWSLNRRKLNFKVGTRVADSDPVGYGRIRSFWVTIIRIRERNRIQILYPQKYHCNSYKSVYNTLVKIIFNSLILSVIRCLNLVRKCHETIIYLAQHQIHILVESGSKSGSGLFGPPGYGSEKNWPDPQHWYEQ